MMMKRLRNRSAPLYNLESNTQQHKKITRERESILKLYINDLVNNLPKLLINLPFMNFKNPLFFSNTENLRFEGEIHEMQRGPSSLVKLTHSDSSFDSPPTLLHIFTLNTIHFRMCCSGRERFSHLSNSSVLRVFAEAKLHLHFHFMYAKNPSEVNMQRAEESEKRGWLMRELIKFIDNLSTPPVAAMLHYIHSFRHFFCIGFFRN